MFWGTDILMLFQKKIIKNFQRKYRQNRVDGILDKETYEISEFLVKKTKYFLIFYKFLL